MASAASREKKIGGCGESSARARPERLRCPGRCQGVAVCGGLSPISPLRRDESRTATLRLGDPVMEVRERDEDRDKEETWEEPTQPSRTTDNWVGVVWIAPTIKKNDPGKRVRKGAVRTERGEVEESSHVPGVMWLSQVWDRLSGRVWGLPHKKGEAGNKREERDGKAPQATI
ncbi:hypothetical protein NDU88_008913 [Pleurodeles waltl]|uniref:Uncharacterized protein n=1 Tax=Pleurodeles waltl TaxID=8319 RepID=A0AAV7PTG6_PLEWA|nr:hypothetical protein NDU88_008913 [Pleurodeles waltl]